MIRRLVITLLFCFSVINIFSQVDIIKDPVRKKAYKKVIEQANQLFDNKQYTASIHFYKKALEIAPEKKLAKYRLEDIKTIFIKDEMAENKQEAEELIETISEAVQEIEENLSEEKKDSLIYYLSDMDSKTATKIDERPEEWIEIESSVRNEIIAESKVASDEPAEEKKKVNVEIVRDPVVVEEKSDTEVAKKEPDEKNTEIKKPESKIIQTAPNIKKSSVELQSEREKIEEELKQKYPDEKTVEVIQEQHKKVTRIIINKNNRITVFLKVEHNWGGIFYFIDKSPFPVQSITKNYFIAHTQIK